MARKNYLSIHFMRIMACLMVILIHITATPVISLNQNSFAQIFFILVNQIAKPAVPVFIFISGFLLHSIYREKECSPISYWRKRLPKLIIPYVLWSLGYYLIYMQMGYYPLDFDFIIQGLIHGSFIYHLYFMVIIIQFYILYPFLHFLTRKFDEKIVFLLILIVQIGLIKVPFEFRDRLFITYFSYFGLGLLVQATLPRLKEASKSFALYFCAFIGAGIIHSLLLLNSQNAWLEVPSLGDSLTYVILSIVSIWSLFFGFEKLSEKIELQPHRLKQIGRLGDATQLIYYAHPLFILGSEYFMNYFGVVSISLRALSAFLAIILVLVPLAYLGKGLGSKMRPQKEVK